MGEDEELRDVAAQLDALAAQVRAGAGRLGALAGLRWDSAAGEQFRAAAGERVAALRLLADRVEAAALAVRRLAAVVGG